MHLNHLHLKSPDVSASCKFYEEIFGFRFAFADGNLHFLVNERGFLLALDQYAPGEEPVAFPKWFHIGFCQDTRAKVEEMYERAKTAGVKFASDLKHENDWIDFKCLDPGGYIVEVSWHRADCENAPELTTALDGKRS